MEYIRCRYKCTLTTGNSAGPLFSNGLKWKHETEDIKDGTISTHTFTCSEVASAEVSDITIIKIIKQEDVQTSDLDLYKQVKREKIDESSQIMIAQGFQFAGITFSLSEQARQNWIALKAAMDGGLLTESNFPYPVMAQDDLTLYNLPFTAANLFFGTALATTSQVLTYGRVIKNAINSCSSMTEVDCVYDFRYPIETHGQTIYTVYTTTSAASAERASEGFVGGTTSTDGSMIIGDRNQTVPPTITDIPTKPAYCGINFPYWPHMFVHEAQLLLSIEAVSAGASDGFIAPK